VTPEIRDLLVRASYLVASVLFILCLRGLSSPTTARRGLIMGEVGMLIAIVGTLLKHDVVSYEWIVVGLIVGTLVGIPMGLWIPMTKMPERIALSHAFGGLAAALVGVSEYYRHVFPEAGAEHVTLDSFTSGAVGFEVLFGFLTFTGSLMAFGKLQGVITGAPITYPGQNASNIGLFVAALAALVYVVWDPSQASAFWAMCVIGTLLGILFVLPIGGADMPVVISLLNSYAGLAACATGFALDNNVLIIAGALDGASGFLLSIMMSKAMNRSFTNVLFGAFGAAPPEGAQAQQPAAGQNVNISTIEDAAELLGAAQSVIVVPGYGMAVSQAQHAVRDLAAALETRGADVKYAIHPVAGRMPGHMNVLLAEANISYERLFDIEDINDDFQRTDVVLVIGANDVVNPAAKKNPASPIYGMPVFNVEQAKLVMVLKRSMNPGFAGIDNELFVQPNTVMVLGDARKTILSMLSAVKGGGGH
jgi:H+-translocating NAD(P) transhydrogenase subunit beta